MRIMAIADVHDCAEQISSLQDHDADLIAICGDLHDDGTREDAMRTIAALGRFPQSKLIVPGNMDAPNIASELWQKSGLIDLDRRVWKKGEVAFYGIGGIVPRNPRRIGDPGRFYRSDLDIYETLSSCDAIANSPLRVVLTHQPPRGLRDRLYNKEASGGEGLLAYVKEREPDLLLCGHIHEDRGEARLGRTRIVNAGELRRGSAAIVDIEIGGRIEVKWI